MSTNSITVTGGKKTTSTGKPIAPSVPAPKPKEEEKKEGEKAKPLPVPVATPVIVKKKLLEGEVMDEDEDDGEPTEVSVTEIAGGEA